MKEPSPGEEAFAPKKDVEADMLGGESGDQIPHFASPALQLMTRSKSRSARRLRLYSQQHRCFWIMKEMRLGSRVTAFSPQRASYLVVISRPHKGEEGCM